MKKIICKNCINWKNEQAELEYSKFNGICTCSKWKFNTNNEADCCVLDRECPSDKHMGVQRFENQNSAVPISRADHSRYCLVTAHNFGCIHFDDKKK